MRLLGWLTPPPSTHTHEVWTLTGISGSLGNEMWEPEPCYCAATEDHDAGQEVSA